MMDQPSGLDNQHTICKIHQGFFALLSKKESFLRPKKICVCGKRMRKSGKNDFVIGLFLVEELEVVYFPRGRQIRRDFRKQIYFASHEVH